MIDLWPDEPDTVRRLSRPEHLLVWSMRAIALGHEECPAVVRAFRAACGARGDQMLQTYAVFIKYLAMASPRRLQVHVPGCICVASDEAAALAILAAGQRSLHDRSEIALRRALGDLIGERQDESLILVVQGVADLLSACGLELPDRTGEAGARDETGPAQACRMH